MELVNFVYGTWNILLQCENVFESGDMVTTLNYNY